MRRVRILSYFLVLLLVGCTAAPTQEASEPYTAEIFAMDTIMTLTVYGPHGQEAAGLAIQKIHDLEALLSVTDGESEIYAANHSEGEPVALSPDTITLLSRVLDLCESTGGALDITIQPVLQAWGFTTGEYHVPEEQELAVLLERVDYTTVSLADSVLTLPENVQLDLGAVAKGHTGDALMELFRKAGVTSAIVELGGNVQALGAKPDGSPWRVGIQSPEGSGYAGVLEITDKAVVTSGGYQRYFEQDGNTYWHILDPADGRPAQSGLVSVTIIADEGVVCDALSTALFVMGTEAAAEYWRKTGGFDFVLIDEAGTVTITEGLVDSFSSMVRGRIILWRCFGMRHSGEGRTAQIARYALLTALAMVLSWLESMIPFPAAVPGMKLGLTNLVVIFALYRMSVWDSIGISLLRVLLVSMTFGNAYSFAYSLAGAVLSWSIMVWLKRSERFSVLGVSIAGGVGHNIGQIVVAMAVLDTLQIAWYLPPLMISGTLAG